MDQVTDKNMAGIYKISRLVEIPDFVKEAAARDYDSLPAHCFADPVQRSYPMDTPEDVWKSWCYLQRFGEHKTAAVEQALKDRAVFFDVELPQLAPPTEEAQGITIKYAYANESHGEVRVRDIDDLNKVAADLQENSQRYPFPMRHAVAKQLLSAVKTMGGRFPGEREVALQKMACYGAGSLTNALDVFRLRREAVRRLGYELEDISGDLEKQANNGVLPPEFCEKLACFADACDRLVGLHRRYGKGVQPPEEKLITVTLRDMDNLEQHTVKIAGRYVSESDVAQPAIRNLLNNLHGETLANDRLLSALRELPPEHQRLVGRVLA